MECPRCHYSTRKRSNYLTHLHRKIPCPSTFATVSCGDLLLAIANEQPASSVCSCVDCHREFSSAQYLNQHITTCVVAMRKQLTSQATLLTDMQEQLLQTQTTHINIINVLTLNNFGSENRSYITREDLQKCLDNMRVHPLVDLLYFHPDHPENHTVRLKSEKKGRLIVHQDGVWIEVDMNASIDSMIQIENRNLCKYFYEHVWPDPSINFDIKAYAQSKLVKIADKSTHHFDQRRSIQASIKNAAEQLMLQ